MLVTEPEFKPKTDFPPPYDHHKADPHSKSGRLTAMIVEQSRLNKDAVFKYGSMKSLRTGRAAIFNALRRHGVSVTTRSKRVSAVDIWLYVRVSE